MVSRDYSKRKHCKECGQLITNKAERCSSCSLILNEKRRKHSNIFKLTEIEKSYIAGIVDGEGCIRISKVDSGAIKRLHNRYTLTIQIQMVDKKVVSWLHQKCKGYLYFQPINLTKYPNCRDRYRWTLQNFDCQYFLEVILPYLKLKNKQAKIGLKFLALLPGNIKTKHLYWEKISKLNQTGRNEDASI